MVEDGIERLHYILNEPVKSMSTSANTTQSFQFFIKVVGSGDTFISFVCTLVFLHKKKERRRTLLLLLVQQEIIKQFKGIFLHCTLLYCIYFPRHSVVLFTLNTYFSSLFTQYAFVCFHFKNKTWEMKFISTLLLYI